MSQKHKHIFPGISNYKQKDFHTSRLISPFWKYFSQSTVPDISKFKEIFLQISRNVYKNISRYLKTCTKNIARYLKNINENNSRCLERIKQILHDASKHKQTIFPDVSKQLNISRNFRTYNKNIQMIKTLNKNISRCLEN